MLVLSWMAFLLEMAIPKLLKTSMSLEEEEPEVTESKDLTNFQANYAWRSKSLHWAISHIFYGRLRDNCQYWSCAEQIPFSVSFPICWTRLHVKMRSKMILLPRPSCFCSFAQFFLEISAFMGAKVTDIARAKLLFLTASGFVSILSFSQSVRVNKSSWPAETIHPTIPSTLVTTIFVQVFSTIYKCRIPLANVANVKWRGVHWAYKI